MLHKLIGLAALLLLAACTPVERPPSKAEALLVIQDVTVIDVTSGATQVSLPRRTVTIAGGRIQSVLPVGTGRAPRGARIIDGRGRFLIPGLWDSHTHLSTFGEPALPLLVSQGVTSVRDMGGRASELRAWRDSIIQGRRTGPRIVFASGMIEGAWWLDRVTEAVKTTPVLASFPFMELTPRYRISGPGDASRAVEMASAGGVDLIKFRNLRADEFAAVAAEAKRLGLPLSGHAPQGVSPGEAAEAGMGSIEHMETLSLRMDKATEAERRREFVRVARAGGMITPTLISDVTYRQTADERGYSIIADTANRIDSRRRYLSAGALAAWRFGLDIKKLEGPGRNSAALHQRQIDDVRLARDSGVPLLIGTDITVPLIFPGYSVHEEMRYLVEKAGLLPIEALRGATIYPARLIRDGSSGRIAPGQRADLLLLGADPLQSIAATQQIELVILNGRALGRTALDALREQSAALASRP